MPYRIFIDPGHGGSDRANRGPTGYIEADGALDIALRLRDKLQSLGFTVGMSRDKDATVGLTQRGKMAGQFKADLFLSIHSNAGSSVAAGTEVYYSVDLPNTKALAEKMSSAVASALGIPNRGAKVRESQNYPGEDYYTVIDTAQDSGVPRVFLIEVAFHSNPNEEALLKQPAIRQKIADTLAQVIADEFGVKSVTTIISVAPMDAIGTVSVNSTLNVRKGPETDYSVIGSLKNGEKVAITGQTGGWYKIKYNNGDGYVSKQYVTVTNNTQEVNEAVDSIVVYNNYVDKRAAEYLADYLHCPTTSEDNYKVGIAKKIYAVGPANIKGATVIKGQDRFDTMIAVLKFIGKLE